MFKIYGIPHKRDLLKNIENKICTIPILFSGKGICFGSAERYREEICVVSWYNCREVFHDDYPLSNHLFVNYNSKSFFILEKYIETLESLLKIENKSEFYRTNRKPCMMIILSNFWKKKIKFTLLTLLIRFCLKYEKSTFELNDLKKCSLLKDTIPAISLLLDGKIKYFGKNYSWYDQFKLLNFEESSKYLR